jgi:hypothetical protein
MKTTQEIINEFKALQDNMRQPIRQYASCLLLDENENEEIGSSDISCKVVQLYKENGSFHNVLLKYMEYLFC